MRTIIPQTKRTTMRNTEDSDREVYKLSDEEHGTVQEAKQLTVQQLARNPQLGQKNIEKMEPDEIRALCVQVRERVESGCGRGRVDSGHDMEDML